MGSRNALAHMEYEYPFNFLAFFAILASVQVKIHCISLEIDTARDTEKKRGKETDKLVL